MRGGNGVDGAIFIWFVWMGVVITVFFQKPSLERTGSAFLMLVAICVVNKTVNLMGFSVAVVLVLAYICGYLLWIKNGVKTVYAMILLIMLTAAYTSIQLFAIYDPVFTYLYTKWSVAAILFIIIHLTLNGFAERCSLLILSIVHGEVILTMIFRGMGFERTAGELASFDVMAISIMATWVWSSFVKLTVHLEKTVKKHQERRGYS